MKQFTFSAQVANNLLTVLQGYSKTIRLLLVMFLTLTVTTNAWAEEATLSFANKAQRTSFSTTKQVWEQNGVTFTNDKASSTNAVADYANPVRLYANSSVTVECSLGNMTEIVFNANTTGYATTLGTSIGNTATVSSKAVTVTLDGTSNTFTVAKLSGQVRLDNITVTYTAGGGDPVDPYTVTFDAGSGTCDDESLTETSGGAGVTLPTANPPATCATNGWKFAGWWTGSVAETTTSPGELLTAGSNYKPASDCTLYAVYSHTEAGGGDSPVAFNFSDIASANSWTNGIAYTTVTISPITINAIGGGNNGKYYTSLIHHGACTMVVVYKYLQT